MSHFHYLSDLGETSLPSRIEMEEITSRDEELLILLDSCVCLDIVNFLKHKKSFHGDKNKIFNLVEYVQKKGVDFTPIFALSELCYDKVTLEILDDKLWDIKNKVDFIFKYPIKLLKRFEFDYDLNFHLFNEQKNLNRSIKPIMSNLHLYYAALLKIREIANRGLKKENAEKNIELFIEWMEDELDVFLGLEYALAIEIFGGNSKLRSMIKFGANKEVTLKALWGTAWDLFHARMSCNRPQLGAMVGKNIHPIFVTKDSSLYKLMAPHVEHIVRFNSMKMTITTGNSYPQHYSDQFMAGLNEKILRLSTERVTKTKTLDLNKINAITTKLENNLE